MGLQHLQILRIGGLVMEIRNSEGYVDIVPFKAISNIERNESHPFRPLVYICAPFSRDIDSNKKRAAEFAVIWSIFFVTLTLKK